MLSQKLERVLQKVQKPARYTGGEYKQVVKDKKTVDVRVALCFPDIYEIGMSNLGVRIIYGILNRLDGVWCERVFAPWSDMEEQMRSGRIPLYGLESGDPLSQFDIIAFSIGYELSYTSIINMLDLAGIDIKAEHRSLSAPLVIAGGTCCYNPEPLADFFDLFVIGEGEEVIGEIIDLYRNSEYGRLLGNSKQRSGRSCQNSYDKQVNGKTGPKRIFLENAASIPGVYVPELYEFKYDDCGAVADISAMDGAPLPVRKRVVENLDDSYFPVDTIVPSIGIVHDRSVLELFRGCFRGCRFCQAGFVNRPVRSRSCETLIRQGIESICSSGYDEISLMSLSTSDYKHLVPLCDGLLDWCRPRMINLSLPSLRVDNFSVELLERVQEVRKSGLTFAPEAGSQRLRDVINKNVTEEDLLSACRVAFEGGWNAVKLYFMLGLPTETDEDVVAVAQLSRAVLNTWKRFSLNKSRGVRITVSTSCFIPKPHTPFQWEAQIRPEEYVRRAALLKASIGTKAIVYNWHSPEQGFIEAALARGDRRLGSVIMTAWQLGARFDSWSECFSYEKWLLAFEKCGIDPDYYSLRERPYDEKLPWSLVSAGLKDELLYSERLASRECVAL